MDEAQSGAKATDGNRFPPTFNDFHRCSLTFNRFHWISMISNRVFNEFEMNFNDFQWLSLVFKGDSSLIRLDVLRWPRNRQVVPKFALRSFSRRSRVTNLEAGHDALSILASNDGAFKPFYLKSLGGVAMDGDTRWTVLHSHLGS